MAWATGLVIGVFLMEVLGLLGGLRSEHWPATFLLLVLLAVTVHELGHLLAGRAVGFHFSSIQFGPLLFENEYGAIRAQISFDMIGLGYTGMYADRVRKLRRRLLIYIAGGPVANLLTVIVVVVVGDLHPSSSDSWLATAVGQFGASAISLLLALFSMVPYPPTDGAETEMLLYSPLPARRFMSTVGLGAQFNQGIRARDWKRTWVKAATFLPDKSRGEFYACWMAYLFANDRKDADRAAHYLERCLSLAPVLTTRFRDLIAQEAAVFCAWFKMNPSLADKWLLQMKSRRSLAPIPQARIEVALHCAHRDFDNAITTCETTLGLIQRLPIKPSNASLRESWLEWRADIQERKNQTVTS
jgi:Zn-dependent protease